MIPGVRVVKRVVDLFGATSALVCTAPLFPLIGAAIYLESPGPVLYRQRRAGRLLEIDEDGSPRFVEFDMLKFRSMIPDAERHTGQTLASKNDPRITKIGKFLRKTRLDELPQLLNVLRGEMSLVGPRPERPERQVNLSMAIPFFEERMRGIRPGITGLAQTSLGYSGRAPDASDIKAFEEALINPFSLEYLSSDEEDGAEADDMRMKLLYDLSYVMCLESLATYLPMEFSIVFKTPWIMLRGVGR